MAHSTEHTRIMRIYINDEARDIADDSTISSLLADLQLPGTRVAVEVNRSLVRRVDHATTRLQNDDRVEVVTLVGGG